MSQINTVIKLLAYPDLARLCFLISFAVCLGACDSPDTSRELATLHITTTQSQLVIDKALQLELVGKDSNGNALLSLPQIDWNTSDSSRLTVSSTGLVSADQYGQVTVSAAHKNISTSINIDVVADVAAIEFDDSILSGSPIDGVYVFDTIGATVDMAANARDSVGILLSVQPQYNWESSDASVIQVQGNTVTAVGNGEAHVNVSYGDVAAKYYFVVDAQVVSFTINPGSMVFSALSQTSSLSIDTENSYNMVRTGRSEVDGLTWISSDDSIVTVDENGIVTSMSDGLASITATLYELTQSIDVYVVNGGVTASGTIRYEDKEYGLSGFTGKRTYKPVRYAQVDLLDGSDNVVDTTSTDVYGQYSFNLTDVNMSVRVIAQTVPDSAIDVAINDINGDLYSAVKSFVWTIPLTQVDVDIPISSNVAGAFNMLDVFTAGSEMVNALSSITLSNLNAYWRSGSSSYGTYYCWPGLSGFYCPQGSGIYIVGGSIDTDEFDDDVLLHEFGHYLEGVLSLNDSPGGQHYMYDNTLDIRLAWSEGWGDFFHTAVKTWLQNTNPGILSIPVQLGPTYYIDTAGSYAQIALDISNPGTCYNGSDCYVYSSNEIAVAKVLLRLNEDYGMQSILDVYENYLPTVTELKASLETFWDGWLVQNPPGTPDLIALNTIFVDRSIYYREDSFEDDGALDEARKISVCTGSCTGETHYLYRNNGATDSDIIAFDAAAGLTYKVETFNLKNAADTYIRLLDIGGNPVLNSMSQPFENDDRPDTLCATQSLCKNDDLSYASLITFTADNSATYYIEIITSSEVFASSGRYGSYSVKVTQQ